MCPGSEFFSCGAMIRQPEAAVLLAYQMQRILAWLYPDEYPDNRMTSSRIPSLPSDPDSFTEKDLDNNAVSSVKNGNFISEPQTDFIFAVAGEELGFLGCCIIVILELLIALECVQIGRHARDLPGTLIGCGMGALIFFQSFINVCVSNRTDAKHWTSHFRL